MIVVTGATGHVGNVLVRTLVARGAHNVRALGACRAITLDRANGRLSQAQ